MHAQFVHLIEAAAIFGEAHQDIDGLVATGGAIFGGFDAVGHELQRGADDRGIGPELGGLRLINMDLPIDAGQRQPVIQVLDIRKMGKHRGDLLGSRRQ